MEDEEELVGVKGYSRLFNQNNLFWLSNNLSSSHLTLYIALCSFVGGKWNCILHNNYKPMNKSSMMMVLGVKDRTYRNFINKLVDLNLATLLVIRNDECLILNPYFVRGRRKVYATVIPLFKDTGKYKHAEFEGVVEQDIEDIEGFSE